MLILKKFDCMFGAGSQARESVPASLHQSHKALSNTMKTNIVRGGEVSGQANEGMITQLAGSFNDHLDRQIDLADRKAQLILAACTFMAATVAPLTAGIGLDLFNTSVPLLQRIASVFTISVVVTLLLSIYFSLIVTRPILELRKQNPSLLYFGNVIQWSEEEFIERFLKQQPDEIRTAILAQAYQKALISKRKFEGIRRSLGFLLLTFILWGAANVLLGLSR